MHRAGRSSLCKTLTVAFGLAAFGAAPAGALGAQAQYRISIGGVPVGTASLRATRAGSTYEAEAESRFRFLFWGGHGEARSAGRVEGGQLLPDSYQLVYQGSRRPGGAEIDFADGAAIAWASFPDPPAEVFEGRIQITPDHLIDVLDPLSALLVAAPADTDAETVCARVLPVFSGLTRFDIVLNGVTGRDGERVACAVSYRPVAGHRPDSRGVRRMRERGAFEITLAPLGPSFWAPSRVAVSTRVGTVEVVRLD